MSAAYDVEVGDTVISHNDLDRTPRTTGLIVEELLLNGYVRLSVPATTDTYPRTHIVNINALTVVEKATGPLTFRKGERVMTPDMGVAEVMYGGSVDDEYIRVQHDAYRTSDYHWTALEKLPKTS